MASGIHRPQQKSALWAALERCLQGAPASGKSITVSFVKCSTGTSDYSGLVGAHEALLDQLVRCSLIPDDDFETIGKPNYEQIKVGTIKEKGTYIRIEFRE
jgi:hypothetical protein